MENNEPKKYKEGESTLSGFTIENALNKDENDLPFGYFCPEDDKIIWICDYGPPKEDGADPDIISVFQRGEEKRVTMLKDIEEAKYARDELIKVGWKKLTPPKIEFTMDGGDKPLNRRQKRALEKKIKNFKPKD